MKNKGTVLILGGDGYLGWSLCLAFAARTNDKIILVDNLIKRKWEREVKAKPLITLAKTNKRIKEYNKIFGKKNLFFENIDLKDFKKVYKLIKNYRPHTIINAAQQPSAPFSMISPEHAITTIKNNTETNLNMIWAIAGIDKNIKYIKLGSSGCYLGIDCGFIPKHKVDLEFIISNRKKRIINSWLPMQATDFYHQSKIFSFLMSDLCSNMWKLRIATVQQSTIFGATITENKDCDRYSLSTRFNYDQIFGTVINRFVCQSAINYPITVYGDGSQKTGLISLNNTVNNFLKLSQTNIEKGRHFIEHNYTHKLSIMDIANILRKIKSVKVNKMKNPRIEKETLLQKKFEKNDLLNKNSIGMKCLLQEFRDLLDFTEEFKKHINKSIIKPTVNWGK